jgi:molybdate transport system ATP-binding protein
MKPTTTREARPFLSLRQATFRLGDYLIYRNSDWTYRQGEQWIVRGGNGAGKSIFADALRGRLPLVSGELRYHYRAPQGLSLEEAIGHVSFEERRAENHGAVVQSRWNSLEEDEAVRVRDFLAYDQVMETNPFAVGVQDAPQRRRFEYRRRRAIDLLEIGSFLDRALLTLSNGERQRVQLARALCHPLRLLILDEPFTGLDRRSRAYLQGILQRLMRSPLQLLLLTARDEAPFRGITHALDIEDCAIVAAGAISTHRKAERSAMSIRTQPFERRSEVERSRKFLRQGTPLLSLREVTVRYGDKTILERLNWEVQEGESWALVGPNGSGKTTLLSLITGDNPQAYSNEVRVFGKRRGDGESIWELKQKIGWVSPEQQVHLDLDLTCYEVVASGFFETNGLFETPSRRQAAEVARWLREFGLQEEAETPVAGLSAGLQRMVLLARCLVKNPRLLILDEPCQGLDPAHRDLFLAKVDRLISRKVTTVILVTHREEEIPVSIQRVKRLGPGVSSKKAPKI